VARARTGRREGEAPRSAWDLARRFRLAPIAHATDADRAAIAGAPGAWALELAWDGHRVLACRVGADVRLVSPDLREWSDAFPEVVAALRRLPGGALALEGHLCVTDERGHPSFELLRDARARARGVLVAWDLLHVEGEELAAAPLSERRARLDALARAAGAGLTLSEAMPGPLDALLEGVRGLGARGLYARRADASHPSPVVALSATSAPLEWDRTISPPPAVTNATKVLFPRDALTKRDVVDYYASVAPVLLPHLRDRVVVAQRWPDGIDAFTWYQHRIPPRAPDYVRGAWIEGDRRLLVDGVDSLLWLVNQAALTFHTWPSRVTALAEPDWAILDLDPGAATTWADTVTVANTTRALLEALDLPSVLKTSGQRGLHVLVPLAPGHSVQDAHELARLLARALARALPSIATVESEKERRGGRLFVDHLQSFVGKSLACPYTLRAVDGAPVSAPLAWDELSARLEPRALNLRTILRRLDARGDLAAPLLAGRARLAPAIRALRETSG